MSNITFDALWDNLKEENDQDKEVLEVSESIASIINNLVNTRIDKGWSQRDLAAACGLKQSAIARMERLQVIPRLDTIVKIAQKLDVRLCIEKVPVMVEVTEQVVLSDAETVTWPEAETLRYRPRPKMAMAFAAVL